MFHLQANDFYQHPLSRALYPHPCHHQRRAEARYEHLSIGIFVIWETFLMPEATQKSVVDIRLLGRIPSPSSSLSMACGKLQQMLFIGTISGPAPLPPPSACQGLIIIALQ